MLEQFQAHVAEFTPNNLTHEQLIANFAMGLAGESGEVVDLLKKQLFHEENGDRRKLISELGDVFWYWIALCQQFEIPPDEVMGQNMEKLRSRHEGRSFNPEAAAKNKNAVKLG